MWRACFPPAVTRTFRAGQGQPPDHLGLEDAERPHLEGLRAPHLRNHSGLEVGRLEPQLEVASPSL